MTLSTLRKKLASEKKDARIFDIVLYGSTMKGASSPHDLDILVIFKEGTLRERLDTTQGIKQRLKQEQILDVKQILLPDLFSPAFFAKTGILLEGESIFENRPFSERAGFSAWTLFIYDLSKLTFSRKVQFTYLLSGRKSIGTKGILAEFNGVRVVPGAVKIPLASSATFEEILKRQGIVYTKKNILEQM